MRFNESGPVRGLLTAEAPEEEELTPPPETDSPRILVVDVGGTHVKVLATGKKESREIDSGPSMNAKRMVQQVKRLVADWKYESISIGYPGPVVHGRPLRDPYNLAPGWVGFNFQKAFGCPVKVLNDAAMQALGSYQGGNMLFLGLGTGLGSALIVNGLLEPMELAHLPYRKRTYEDYLGLRGLKRMGRKKWERHVGKAAEELRQALQAEYVVFGGGNAKRLKDLPPKCRLGDNRNAFKGGFRIWESEPTST
jgi:polyphosphate glucokinase